LVKFLAVKYASLALTSIRALLLAALLAPTSYGFLGILVLTQQYLSYAALGMREGVAVKLAHAHGNGGSAAVVCSSALFWGWCVGALILCGLLALVGGGLLRSSAWVWVGVVSCLSITNEILININRDQNNLLKVALLELAFNVVLLCAALYFWDKITVSIVLQSMAVGLLVSVLIYALGFDGFRWRHIKANVIGELLRRGIPLALLSLATTSLASAFIFDAGAMKLGDTVGLLVFGNNLCAITLYGLNMASWAATSRVMRQVDKTIDDRHKDVRGDRLTAFLQLGIVLAVSILLCVDFLFRFVMSSYQGSGTFAVYFCLLQSYGLLLYREFTFLAVRSRSLAVAIAYGAIVLSIFAMSAVAPQVGLIALLLGSSAAMFGFSLCCVHYCRRLGYVGSDAKVRVVFLSFPLLFGVTFAALGEAGAASTALLYLFVWLWVHRYQVHAIVTGVRAVERPASIRSDIHG